MKKKLPMNLQFFASGGEGSTGTEETGSQAQAQGTQNNGQTQPVTPEIDYDKLASIIQGKQNVAEDTVLKNYFKQQGLSGDEMTQAINSFKEQKAKNEPNVTELQTQLAQQTKLAQEAQLQNAATLEAISLGYDQKTIPYVLKLADLSGAIGQDGKINTEAIKTAISKVAEELPQLKPTEESSRGFQIGGATTGAQQTSGGANQTQTKAVASKRWNQFNH